MEKLKILDVIDNKGFIKNFGSIEQIYPHKLSHMTNTSVENRTHEGKLLRSKLLKKKTSKNV